MVVRIKLPMGRPRLNRTGKNRHVASAAGVLLGPMALMAWVLGFWRLGADMGVTGEFAFTGMWSHWQIWMIAGALLQGTSYWLNRYAREGEVNVQREVMFHLFPAAKPAKTESEPVADVHSDS